MVTFNLSSEPVLAGAFNFGPDESQKVTVGGIADHFVEVAGGRPWCDASEKQEHAPPEVPMLRLSSRLAGKQLGWAPVLDVATAVDWTAEWHRRMLADEDPVALCREAIARYADAARRAGVAWST